MDFVNNFSWRFTLILMWLIITTKARRSSVSRPQTTDCTRKNAGSKICQDLSNGEEVSCGQHYLLPGSEVVISSQWFFSSRDKSSCKWKFQTHEDFQLLVTCELSLPKKDRCQSSHLLITDGNVRKGKFCGNIKSVGVSSNTGFLNVMSRMNRKGAASSNFKCIVKSHTTDNDAVSKCRCGRVNRPRRILGGSQVEPNEYPWQVALVQKDSIIPFCGGSIISDSWILTAAHCLLVEGKVIGDLKVVIGEHDWSTSLETTITRTLPVKQIIWHPGFNLIHELDNDIGLIQLEEPLVFPEDNSVAPVCLPPPHQNYPNENAIVIGWGMRDKVNEALSETLRVAELTTMTNNVCQGLHILTGTVTRNMICAGYLLSGVDACPGDSGGPLLSPGDDCRGTCVVAIGIVSWGKGSCLGILPAVFARTNRYLDWITLHIEGSTTCQQKP